MTRLILNASVALVLFLSGAATAQDAPLYPEDVDASAVIDAALAQAREAEPDNAQAWLLSATLSRRQNKLIEAQAQIEKAAQLSPRDPEIGLEAGVIAVLAGNEGAARHSWRSVLEMAPDSPAAATAKQYISQLGPESTAKP